MADKRWVLAVDPGKMTGLCVFSLEKGGEPVLEWSYEVEEARFAQAVRHYINTVEGLEVVCERFVITTQTGKNSQAPFSLELIGVLKQCMRDIGKSEADIYFQKPADAMNLFPNAALKKLGYWHKGGKDHANDSIRHALTYLSGNGWMPTGLID
ncbi:RuvC-like resolvase [Microbacterium phage Cece]|nr:RuvC-like resolvase [Microbacterium phage Cece]